MQYLVRKIEERELGKHVFQNFLKNNHLQNKPKKMVHVN